MNHRYILFDLSFFLLLKNKFYRLSKAAIVFALVRQLLTKLSVYLKVYCCRCGPTTVRSTPRHDLKTFTIIWL